MIEQINNAMNTTKLSANTTNQPECWDTDANAHALRITTTQGRALLLPFEQFAYNAELKG